MKLAGEKLDETEQGGFSHAVSKKPTGPLATGYFNC